MSNDFVADKEKDLCGDGIIKWRDGFYRVHKAWSLSPAVFSRYTVLPTRNNPHGRHVERRLNRGSDRALKVVMKFRNAVRNNKPLEPEETSW